MSDEDAGGVDVEADSPLYLRLSAMARFARTVTEYEWFTRVGGPLTEADRDASFAYLSAVGFPDARISAVSGWEEAAGLAENPEWNTDWWEVEEQLRSGLVTQALEEVDETELTQALQHISAQAAGAATDAANAAAEAAAFDDAEFIQAATGAVVAASYTAGLVLAAGVEDDHPLALKFALLEAGRFPLGIAGSTFSLF
jgi:hypothetical protein